MKRSLFIDSMHGIGDHIYQRPFIQELSLSGKYDQVYIASSVPQLYKDFSDRIKFISPRVEWRTQAKNLKNVTGIKFETVIPDFDDTKKFKTIDPHYGPEMLVRYSIVNYLEKTFEQKFTAPMSLPAKLKSCKINRKKIAVVRPATVRAEWPVTTRNPDPSYIRWCSTILRNAGYYVISIADLEDGKEWALEPFPEADLRIHSGELGIEGTLDLIRKADIVVGGSGWIVPACIAAKTPLFLIFGGRGSFDSPWTLFDIRMDMSNIGWSIPDNFCRCAKNSHPCKKHISNLDSDFYKFMAHIQ